MVTSSSKFIIKRKHVISNEEMNVLSSAASLCKWKEVTKKSMQETCKLHEKDMLSNYGICLLWAVCLAAKEKKIDFDSVKTLLATRQKEEFYLSILEDSLEEFSLDILKVLKESKVDLWQKQNMFQ